MNNVNGISVVICTYNGIDRLEATLISVLKQKVSDDIKWELIIINNASTDSTSQFCSSFLLNHANFISWCVIDEMQPGLNFARLCGLRRASYNWVLFCDDDNHLFNNYLQNAWKIIQNNRSIGALGGFGIPIFEVEKPVWFDRYSHSFAVGPQAASNGKIFDNPSELYGAGTFFRKNPLMKIFTLGFNGIMTDRLGKKLTSGGDVEWCWLLQLLGYEIWFSDELKFYHVLPAVRLNWDYYLNLKEGIASGFGLMQAYYPFFYYKKPSLIDFYKEYIISFIRQFFLWLWFSFKVSINPSLYSFEKRTVGKKVINAKFFSLINNYLYSKKKFLTIKKVLYHSI